LMIAMALLPQPDLIIADEPTTALDVTIQAQILRLLRTLVKERGVSVLFTTHDLGTAHEICDRVVVMYAGQEMETAPADAFFARPAHPYTRRLLASVPSPDGEIRDIPGEVPSLVNPPSGCRFHPRCEYATAECRAGRPPPRERRAVARDLQYVYQDPGASLDPRWKVVHSLHEPLKIHTRLSRAEREREVNAILAAVGLPDAHLDLYPHELSGGQQRRV